MGAIVSTISEKCKEFSIQIGLTTNPPQIPNDAFFSPESPRETLLFPKQPKIENSSHRETTINSLSNKYIELDTYYSNQKRKISLDDFITLNMIGAGSFGTVFLAKLKTQKDSNKYYAMKILEKEKIVELGQIENTLTEREIMSSYKHPFISKLLYSFQDRDKLYLVTDFMPGGDLMHRLISYGRLPEDQAKIYASEIFLAIEYLHSKNIIFRDLKPENILIDKDNHIKLTDFGLSKNLNNSKYYNNKTHRVTFSICGTHFYLAPEVYHGLGYSLEVDWWSFGIVLFEMMTGKFPFKQDKISKRIVPKLNKLNMENCNLSPEAKDIIEKLLCEDALLRLSSAEEIKKHKFFEDINWDDVYNKKYEIKNKIVNDSGDKEESVDDFKKNFQKKYWNKKDIKIKTDKRKGRKNTTIENFSFCYKEEIKA